MNANAPTGLWQPSDLEPVACASCGDARTTPVVTRPDGLHVVECAACGLCFLNPRPREELVPRFYQQNYFENAEGQGPSGYRDYAGSESTLELEEEARRRLNLVRSFLKIPGSRILELGTATGETAAEFARAGANVVGSDLSSWAIEEAKKRHPRVDFRSGGWAAITETERFDLVMAYEVIEHVTSPSAFFETASRHVSPGGWLVLSTPNYECVRRLGADRWLGFQGSFEHLFFFSALSLGRFGQKAGFKLGHWFTGGGTGLATAAAPGADAPKSLRRRVVDSVVGAAGRKVRSELRSRTSLPVHGFHESDPSRHQLVVALQRVSA